MKFFSLISTLFIINSFEYGSCGSSSYVSTTEEPIKSVTSASGISASDYCPIAKKLSTCGLPQAQLAHWTCLVYYVSKGDTGLKSTINGANHYGLFQFSSRVWCSETGSPGRSCNARCNGMSNICRISNFLNSNLNDDCACAMKVYNTNSRGFNPWNFWAANCNTKPLPELEVCGL